MLGYDDFDISLGESMSWTFGRWVSRQEMMSHVLELPHEANSGDIYAVAPRVRREAARQTVREGLR
jgi:hypothetical protein